MAELVKQRKRAKNIQFKTLIHIMEQNPNLCDNKFSPGHTVRDRQRMWEEIAVALNSLGGAVKSARRWAKCWTDKKTEVKKKAYRIMKTSKEPNHDGSSGEALTALDKKLLNLVGLNELSEASENIQEQIIMCAEQPNFPILKEDEVSNEGGNNYCDLSGAFAVSGNHYGHSNPAAGNCSGVSQLHPGSTSQGYSHAHAVSHQPWVSTSVGENQYNYYQLPNSGGTYAHVANNASAQPAAPTSSSTTAPTTPNLPNNRTAAQSATNNSTTNSNNANAGYLTKGLEKIIEKYSINPSAVERNSTSPVPSTIKRLTGLKTATTAGKRSRQSTLLCQLAEEMINAQEEETALKKSADEMDKKRVEMHDQMMKLEERKLAVEERKLRLEENNLRLAKRKMGYQQRLQRWNTWFGCYLNKMGKM